MKEERYFYDPEANGILPPEETVHAIRVLRLKEGDEIFLMDGKGTFYRAEVTMVTNKHLSYTIKETLPQEPAWPHRIHIAVAPTKMMERIEWFAEKATEIGIDEFSFLNCKFSERRNMRTDRIDKIVVAAMKQSHKAWKPQVNDLQSFNSFIEQPREGRKFICHCYNEIPRADLFEELRLSSSAGLPLQLAGFDKAQRLKEGKNLETEEPRNSEITILIGPEGDFSIDEVKFAMEHGYQSVSLGTSRLRTETAALSAVMQAQLSTK